MRIMTIEKIDTINPIIENTINSAQFQTIIRRSPVYHKYKVWLLFRQPSKPMAPITDTYK